MREMGIQGTIKCRKRRTTHSDHAFPRYPNLAEGLKLVRPDQVWVSDVACIHLLREFVYLAVIVDVFTRSIRGWHLARSLDRELTLTALKRALGTGRVPEIHHSDQGGQYAATAYVDTLCIHQVAISTAEVGAAGRMASSNDSSAPSRERRSIYLAIETITVFIGR